MKLAPEVDSQLLLLLLLMMMQLLLRRFDVMILALTLSRLAKEFPRRLHIKFYDFKMCADESLFCGESGKKWQRHKRIKIHNYRRKIL